MKKYLSVKTATGLVIGILLVYTLAGFFLVPFAGKKIIVSSVHDAMGRTAGVESIFFNPYTLETRVKHFYITDPSGTTLCRIDDVYLNLSIASVFRLAPVITALTLDSPELFFVLDEEGKLNISDIIDPPSKPLPDAGNTSGSNPFQFRLSNAKIKNGAVHFSDKIRQQTHVIEDLNLNLPLLTAMEGEHRDPARPVIGFDLNGAPVKIKAKSIPFLSSRDTEIELEISDLDLAPFEKYLPLPPPLKLVSSGRLSLSFLGDYTQDTQKTAGSPVHTFKAGAKFGLTGLDIQTPGNTPLFSCPEFTVEADSPNLFSREIFIRDLGLNQAMLTLERDEQGLLNLAALVPSQENEDSQTSTASPSNFHIHMDRGGLNKGTIVFTDKSVTPVFTTTLSDFDIRVDDLDIEPDRLTGNYETGLQTKAGETLSSKGQFCIDPFLALEGRLDLNGIIFEKYRPYYLPYTGRHLDIGKIDMGLGFKFEMDGDTPVFNFHEGGIFLENIRIQGEKDAVILDVKKLGVSDILVDSTQRLIQVGQVDTGPGLIALIRDKRGEINLVQRLSDMAKPAAASHGSETDTASGANEPATPWEFELGQFRLKNYQVSFFDAIPGEPVELAASNIMVEADNLTRSGGKGKINVSMALQDTGKFDIQGEVMLAESEAVLDLDMGQIQVNPFQPYFTQYLDIRITKGQIGTKGQLHILFSDPKQPKIKFTGQATLNEFISKTKIDEDDFFTCKSLYLDGMDISTAPVKVNIKEIALTDYYQKTMISELGQLNLKNILKERPEDTGAVKETLPPQPPGPEINIQTITIQGGHIHFADHYNSPGFIANMTQIGGSITGLSSLQNKGPAQVQLKGTHSQHAPLDISGTIDPLKSAPETDLAISFKNIELPEFNAYAEKYLGYEIKKGKLILDLKYNVKAGKLTSSNQIIFDQLTLGNSVKSPDATSLPVQLAISLLKNPRGEIELDLPVQGDLSDPEFSYGNVIVTTFKNIILGVVTAPFKFLGSLTGLGENDDLGHVDFAPGSDSLDEENASKLDSLITVLAEKENLSLEINGKYDLVKDGEQLREQKYQTLLISMLPKGKTQTQETLGGLSVEQRNELIESAYSRAEFPKPRDKSGKEKEISPQEKTKLLITAQTIDENELDALGRIRSIRIRDYMVGSGKIAPLRVFVTEPDPIEGEQMSGLRVKTVFVLK